MSDTMEEPKKVGEQGSYTGYLAPFTDEILNLSNQGWSDSQIANALKERGTTTSPAMVRYVLQRHSVPDNTPRITKKPFIPLDSKVEEFRQATERLTKHLLTFQPQSPQEYKILALWFKTLEDVK